MYITDMCIICIRNFYGFLFKQNIFRTFTQFSCLITW